MKNRKFEDNLLKSIERMAENGESTIGICVDGSRKFRQKAVKFLERKGYIESALLSKDINHVFYCRADSCFC